MNYENCQTKLIMNSPCAFEDSMGVTDEEDESKSILPAEDESSIEH